ncbi:MAG: metal ABC transporter substrate-binding protein [Verrucomicrobiales bacterium]
MKIFRNPLLMGALLLFGTWASAAPVKVAALHPLMADLARQVGGERVEVFDMIGEGGDPHQYEPRPDDLRRLQDSALILAGGKRLESYLDRVRDTLRGVPVVEVGHTIPSLTVGKDAVYACCPGHAAGSMDPHWWHGIENMRRASRIVSQALTSVDPAGKDSYAARATAYSNRLGELKGWAKAELAKVPRGQRKLVTAHNAFAYFAREFGFEVIAVAGLNKEQNTAPQDLARTIQSVRDSGMKAIFPEEGASPKTVESIARETGTRVAEPLIADGNGTGKDSGFEGMIRHNVRVITTALAP